MITRLLGMMSSSARVRERYSYLTVMRMVRRSSTKNYQIIYASVIPEGNLADHIKNLKRVIFNSVYGPNSIRGDL